MARSDFQIFGLFRFSGFLGGLIKLEMFMLLHNQYISVCKNSFSFPLFLFISALPFSLKAYADVCLSFAFPSLFFLFPDIFIIFSFVYTFPPYMYNIFLASMDCLSLFSSTQIELKHIVDYASYNTFIILCMGKN